MKKLTKKQLANLEKHRGLEISKSNEDTLLDFTTNGMAWLLNMQYGSKEGKERELRVKAFRLPVYDNEKAYVSFCFYLNGSPPRAIYIHHDARTDVCDSFAPDVQVYERFGFNKEKWNVTVHFTDAEVKKLAAGEALIVEPT